MYSINLNHKSKPMLYNLGLVFQIVNSPQQKKIHQTKVYSSPLCLVLTQAQIFWKRNPLIPSDFPLMRRSVTKKAEQFLQTSIFDWWNLFIHQKKTIWHIGIWQNRCFGHFLSNNNEVLPNCSIFCPSERKFEGKRDFFPENPGQSLVSSRCKSTICAFRPCF